MRIVLIGPHGAGKTSLGRVLAQRLGLPFDEEIGRQLAEQGVLRQRGRCAATADDLFDAEVLRRELARDAERGETPRIVETWHPGNFAYAARRSPTIAASYAGMRATLAGTAYVLPVRASRTTLSRRQNEPGPLDFFINVGRDAEHRAASLGLTCLPAVHTDRMSPAALAERLEPFFRRLIEQDERRRRAHAGNEPLRDDDRRVA